MGRGRRCAPLAFAGSGPSARQAGLSKRREAHFFCSRDKDSMSRRTDELLALRDLAVIVHALLDGAVELAAVREAVLLCDALRPRGYEPRKRFGADGGEGGGCVDFDLALPGTSPEEQILKSKSKPPIGPNQFGPTRATWLSPFGAAWVGRFGVGSQPPWGILARSLKALVAEHGSDEVARRFKNYLSTAEARYVSVPRFAETFGAWTTANPDAWKHDPVEPRPGEDGDAYLARQIRGMR